MALFRKFFYKKPPDGLLEISERVYVFDYCFTTDVMDEDEYKVYVRGIIEQLRDHFPDASYMVFNMREGENQSQISNILCDYDMTVMDYPKQYEGCPLLTMEMIHHFLRSGENWLQLGLQNIVLMHCDRGGWPVLAFMLAALLIYRKQFTGEQKTLDMIYKQGSRELLQLMSPLNPLPSQLRYLQYISRRNVGVEWPPLDRALTLDCIIIRLIPNMDGEGGCRPIFRIYGQDPFMAADKTPKVLFSTPKRSKLVRYYKQADCELVKIDIHCHVQGDVVLECITLDSDLEREKMMFRVMFNTAFIRSNILMLNRDEIDTIWDVKDQFPKNFRVEVLFSDMEAASSVISIDLPRIEEKEGLPIEAFAKVKEIFSNVDWLDSKTEVATVLQQITASNLLLEKLDTGTSAATSRTLKERLSGGLKFDSKTQGDMKSLDSTVQEQPPMSSFESTGDGSMENKLETLELMALLENNTKNLAHMAQGNQPIPSFGLSTDLDSTRKEFKSLESKESLENDTKFPTSQGKQSTPLVEPSMKESVENGTKFPTSMAEGKQSTPLFEPSMKPLEIDTKVPTSMVEGKRSSPLVEPSIKGSLENDPQLSTSMAKGKQSIRFVEPSMTESLENDTKLPAYMAQQPPMKESLENDTKLPAYMAQGKQSTPLVEPSMKELLENDTKHPPSIAQGKQSSLFEPSMKKLLEIDTKLPASMAQGIQSIPLVELPMKESLENDTKLPVYIAQWKQSTPFVEPSMKELLENDTKRPLSIAQGKQSSLFEPSMKKSLEIDTNLPASMAQGKQSSPLVEPSMKESLESDTKLPACMAQGKQSTSFVEPSMKELLENDSKCPPSIAQGKQSSLFEPSMKKSLEIDTKLLASMAQGKQSSPLVEPSMKESLKNYSKLPTYMAQGKQSTPLVEPSMKESSENKTKLPTSMAQVEQSTPLFEASMKANSVRNNFGSLESNEKGIESSQYKTLLENDTMYPTSVDQGKQSISSIESSTDANSILLESNKKDTESLDSMSLLENDGRFKFKPQIQSMTSAVQGKHSMPSFELFVDAPMQKKIDLVESNAVPKSNIKSPAPMVQATQPIPSFGPTIDSNSTTTQVESLETKASAKNDNKFPTSMAQEKQSIPLIKPSMDANSMEKKIAPLESKQMDIESLESETLFKTDTKGSTSTAQGKPSTDVNSMQKKVGELESKVMSETDAKSLTSTDKRKQLSPLLEPPVDAISIKRETEPQELQVSLQLPTQSKIISPWVHQAIRSAAVPSNNSSPCSPGAISRYKSAPSALGITSVLQDDAPIDIKEEVTHAMKSLPSGIMSPSDSKMPKSVGPSSDSVPAASPQALLPSLPLKPSMDAVAVIEKIAPAVAPPRPPPPPPPPPPLPPQHEPAAKSTPSIVTQQPEDTMHDRGQISLVTSTPPPPPSLPGMSPSTVKGSFKSPPPPPPPPPAPSSTGQISSSSIPPPPPLSGLPPSAASPLSSQSSMNKSADISGPPPPPPPPKPSGTAPGSTTVSLVPPPPPPPSSASKSSLPNSAVNVPPVPPPLLPSANGLSQPGAASLQSHANVPPVPGPPAGAPFGAKVRGVLRANARSMSQTKRSTLKPYHWLKLTRVMQGSLWAETQRLEEVSRAPEFDISELESLFSAAAPNSDNGKGGKSNRRSGQKADKVQLIELRRAYNCEIMLSKVKIPLPDLVSSVLALDESVLDVDQVENLIKFCPTKEEMELLKGYTGDKENLGKCEQFFLELLKVPRVESKLRVFSFKIQFNSQVSELRRDLNFVNSASEEIRNSVKLKRIMQTILSLGNALNHGTARGSAIGFRLDSLLKLTDTRAKNNKMTLMHYLCRVLAEKLPELLEFPQDLVNLEASTKLQLKYLAEEMQAISKGLEKVVQELTASENDGPVSEYFCQILKEFLSDAEAEVRSLAQLYANVGRNADALALYFGEDPARCSFEQVVSTLLNFVRMFIRAHEENRKQIEFEKKKAEKEAENEKLKLSTKESENMMRKHIKSGNIK